MGPAAFLLALCAAAAAGEDLAWRRPPLVDHGVVSFIHLPKTGGTSLIMALAAWAEARGLPFFHDHGTCDPSHGRTCEALSPRRPRTYGLPTRRWEATIAAAAPGALKWPLLFASHGVRHGTVAFWEDNADPCVEINRWNARVQQNFKPLYLSQIEVDSADFWTNRLLSSSSRSTAEKLASKLSHVRTLKSG